MVKYHLGENGPAECKASKRACPVGGEHFDSLEKAGEAFAKTMGDGVRSIRRSIKIDVLNDEKLSRAFANASSYRKNVRVTARVAKPGEHLDTILKDGTVETSRILKGGEFIVMNPGGEEYAMGADKFLSRYEKDGNEWRSTGVIRAIKNPYSRPITIDASWGEEQYGDSDCYIGETPDGERYILGNSEFRETYVSMDNVSNSYGSITSSIKPMAGGRYYGAHVPNSSVSLGLHKVREIVGDEKFEEMKRFKANRDRGEVYHLTVVSPPEMESLKNSGSLKFPEKITVNYLGVGRAVEGDNEAFFMVCESPEVSKWRSDNSLPPKDLHVTLAFMNRDVHSKSKGVDSLIS